MNEIICYNKYGNKRIATLRTPIIPRVGETISIDIADEDGCCKMAGNITDIEYRFDKNGILVNILMFTDIN